MAIIKHNERTRSNAEIYLKNKENSKVETKMYSNIHFTVKKCMVHTIFLTH